ncbi:hypothetical protein GOL41_02655 [Sinorhizobium medicae]|uniref:Transmembrane protein n=3 Tax=Sinorhizobium medicae TaxID=110321 RepID=A6U7R1_SINMW|nr:hypothetical protein Smed_0835 [Sinorhizobium medicae WSM419]MDX0407427.1 hypothetical protein [Sinorhizobium medicae]MDX0414763.1 hypothetical protein [Sinorhizobium medicae]MDX0419357.1 hypothetical protein [Sinorhizobium medicae]MDX0449699.1 hypothetical protein [Sinorhizobium medicae]
MWRVGSLLGGVACMIAAGWIGYSYRAGDTLFEPILAFLGLFGAWAFAETKAVAPEPRTALLHPHDVVLGQKVRDCFTERNKRYLRENSFGASFRYASLDFVRDFLERQGPEHEFENASLDNLVAEISQKAAALCERIDQYGNPISHRDEWWSLAPEQERISDWHSKETSQKIAEVDRLADEVAEAADAFERTFRKLSPESYLGGANV